MTTKPASVRREALAGWPIFRGLALPDDMAAVSIEINRSLDQTIDQAVGVASDILGSSLAALAFGDQHKLWLVVAGAPIKRSDKLAAHRASREKVWGVLERQGISVPDGSRSDVEISLSGDSFRPIGSIELNLGDLQQTFDVTRRADAACLATHSQADPLPLIASALGQSEGRGGPNVLFAAVQMHSNWTFAARAFGKFDDRSVGMDVFAPDSFLDFLEPAAAAAAEAGILP